MAEHHIDWHPSHHRTFWHDLRDMGFPFILFIDMYYRTEWLYLHTDWGRELLHMFFGGH